VTLKSPEDGLIGVTAARGRKYRLSTMTLFLTVNPTKLIVVEEIFAFSKPWIVKDTVDPTA
jgi:hypothetical protein